MDLFFPAFCVGCQKEGGYLCEDCFSLINISEKPQPSPEHLDYLFCAAPYNNFIVKRLVDQFLEPPYIRETAKPLSSLILAHLSSLKEPPSLNKLIPLKKEKKQIKKIGYDPAEEITKELLSFKSKGESILLIDILLDREKLERKAKELKEKGAEEVSALVVAGR